MDVPAQPTVAVLVPCHNEGIAIGRVVADFREKLPDATVYVYDNNSTDDTRARAAEAGAVVRAERMQGKGHVVRRMFADVRYIGINWFTHATRGHQLYDDIAHAVLTHRGPRYVLRSPVATIEDSNLLSQMLAGYREVGCRPVVSSLERDRHGRMAAKPVLLCRLTPAA